MLVIYINTRSTRVRMQHILSACRCVPFVLFVFMMMMPFICSFRNKSEIDVGVSCLSEAQHIRLE